MVRRIIFALVLLRHAIHTYLVGYGARAIVMRERLWTWKYRVHYATILRL